MSHKPKDKANKKKSTTRVIQKGTRVTLRARLNTDGSKETLFLDYLENGNRKFESLDYKLYTKPSDDHQTGQNKKQLTLALTFRNKKENELIDSSNGSNIIYDGSLNFIEYFNSCKKVPDKKGKRKSVGTVAIYDSVIKAMTEFYGEKINRLRIKDIKENLINDFKNYLLSEQKTDSKTGASIRKYNNDTASVYFSKLVYVMGRAIKDKHIKDNPLVSVDRISLNERSFEYLTFEELQTLNSYPCEIEVLKRAAMFSARTGLRAGDIMSLKWSNIVKVKEGYNIVFTQEKTGQTEYLPITQDTYNLLGKEGDKEDKLFLGFDNKKYNNALKLWVAKAGITKDITFHSFRHSHAIFLGSHTGANLYEISKILGHKSIKTTERYYAKVLDTTKRTLIDKLPKF